MRCCLSETSRGRKWVWEKRKCDTDTQQNEMRCPRVCMEVPLRRNYSVYTLSPNINSGFPTVSAKAPGLYCTILESTGGKRHSVCFILYTPPDHAHYVLGPLDLLYSETLKTLLLGIVQCLCQENVWNNFLSAPFVMTTTRRWREKLALWWRVQRTETNMAAKNNTGAAVLLSFATHVNYNLSGEFLFLKCFF